MKPSNFQLTSDYMALAKYDKRVQTITIPANDNSSLEFFEQFFNLPVPAQQGAIDRIQVEIGGKVSPDPTPYFSIANATNSVLGNFSVYRDSPSNIRVRVYIYGSDGASFTWPATQAKIYIASFKPPNQF